MSKRGLVVGGIVALVVAFVAAYALSPYLAANALARALRDRDAGKIEGLVDFPSVRENLKADMKAQIMAKMQSDSGLKGNLLAGLGMILAPALVDNAVDALVTPQSIVSLSETGHAKVSLDNQPPQPDPAAAPRRKPKLALAYAGLDGFHAVATAKDGAQITFVMARQALFGWQVKKIELPPRLLDHVARS